MIAAAALVTIAATSFFFALLRPRNSDEPHHRVVRFALPLPTEAGPLAGAQFAVSPDSTQVALVAQDPDGQQRLWVRRLQSLEWQQQPRTEGAAFPFWSPDSRHVGFFTDRSLKRIDIANGITQTLCDAPLGRGGTWSSEGVIVFGAGPVGPLFRVPASGGTPEPVTALDETRQEVAHRWPHFLPDGRHFVFRVDAEPKGGTTIGLHVSDLDTGERHMLVPGRGSAALAGDVLLYVGGAALVAQGIDTTRGELIGDAQTIGGTEEIAGETTTGSAFSASRDVLVHGAGSERLSQLLWFDRTGRAIGVADDPADYESISLSPDGRRLAVARRQPREGPTSLWVMELDRDRTSRLTLGAGQDASPVWSPDGARLAFASRVDETEGVYTTLASGGDKNETLLKSTASARPTDWSLDGRFLIYATTSPKTRSDLWVLPFGEERKPHPLYQTPANESDARFSPDGRWVAYVSDESGREEVYVRPFPLPEGRWQISTSGGTQPRWRRDGREMYFVAADGQLVAVDVRADPGLHAGNPRPLFSVRGATSFVPTPDGQRFLVQMPVRQRGDDQLQVVLNWRAELRR